MKTVTEMGLDHADCHYSTFIDELTITAGQGDLSPEGEFSIPCPECVDHMERMMRREIVLRAARSAQCKEDGR